MRHGHTFRCADCGFEMGHTCSVPKPEPEPSRHAPILAVRRQKAPRAPSPAPARADLPTLHRYTIVDSISQHTTGISLNELVSPDTNRKESTPDSLFYSVPVVSKPGTAKNGEMAQSSFVEPPQPPRPTVPDKLAEFDRIMRRSRKYRPTEKFYARVMSKYGDIPYLDFAEQAENAIAWLKANPKRYSEITDVCLFMGKWLVRAAEDAGKIARANGVYRNTHVKRPTGTAQSLRMGGGLTSAQNSSVDRMEREARQHYEQ